MIEDLEALWPGHDQTDRHAFLNRVSRVRADTTVWHRIIEVMEQSRERSRPSGSTIRLR
jgi:hypothetical protein